VTREEILGALAPFARVDGFDVEEVRGFLAARADGSDLANDLGRALVSGQLTPARWRSVVPTGARAGRGDRVRL